MHVHHKERVSFLFHPVTHQNLLSWLPPPCCWTPSAGDALKSEQEAKAGLQAVTSSLRSRIANMAATREAHNQQLSGQINKLRAQLDKSKKMQGESQSQVGPAVLCCAD